MLIGPLEAACQSAASARFHAPSSPEDSQHEEVPTLVLVTLAQVGDTEIMLHEVPVFNLNRYLQEPGDGSRLGIHIWTFSRPRDS